jgi:hypothetical protein
MMVFPFCDLRRPQGGRKILEARGGIEPPIMVLQTIALPLGDRATGRKKLSVLSDQSSVSEKNQLRVHLIK